MSSQLLIVNNGLRDLRGHYYETGVSVAEAAAAAGLRPSLFAHADCAADLLGGEFVPLFRTDHWIAEPPSAGQKSRGIRHDPARAASRTIDAVLAGKATLRDYLEARFERTAFLPLPTRPSPLRRLTPPAAIALGRTARDRARNAFRLVKVWGKAMVPPPLFPRARAAWHKFRGRRPAPPPTIDPLAERLARAGIPAEFGYAAVFQHDLERAIGLAGAGPGDHVFLPTAHARELVAVRRLADALGPGLSPTFHLEFRHALDADDSTQYDPIDPNNTHWMYRYTALHRVYFDWCRRLPPNPKVKVYTDTEELSEEYARFSGLPFGTLPIPFRTERIAERTRRPDEPICLTCLGDVRDEKGFPWLPELVRALRPEAEAGRVRFAFQASLSDPSANPLSTRALAALRDMDSPRVRLLGLDGPLEPEAYFAAVSGADAILCPYSPTTYVRRSSGTLTEGIAAGVPTVVPAGTWLAKQQPAGTGTTFTDLPTFIAATRKLVAEYPRFAATARAYRDGWRATHSPASLVRALLAPRPLALPAAA